MNRIKDERGYVSYISQTGEHVREHQLAALVDAPAEEVFDPDRVVHHICHFPAGAGISLDLPGAVVPVSGDVHRELHSDVPGPAGDDNDGADDSAGRAPLSPPIEAVLGRENA